MAHRIIIRQEISILVSWGPNDTCCCCGYRHITGLNGNDVLNKIMWYISCFCSQKKSSQDKVTCGNTLQTAVEALLFFTSPVTLSHTHLSQLSCVLPPEKTDLWWRVLCTTIHRLDTASPYQFNRRSVGIGIKNHAIRITKYPCIP